MKLIKIRRTIVPILKQHSNIYVSSLTILQYCIIVRIDWFDSVDYICLLATQTNTVVCNRIRCTVPIERALLNILAFCWLPTFLLYSHSILHAIQMTYSKYKSGRPIQICLQTPELMRDGSNYSCESDGLNLEWWLLSFHNTLEARYVCCAHIHRSGHRNL